MGELLPLQIEGAAFLAQRRVALLADEPGFGKTAQAVVACDMIGARRILVVTTASARANWINEFNMWSLWGRSAAAVYTTKGPVPDTEIVVVAWSNVAALREDLHAQKWDVLILDESHYAKSPAAARTEAVTGWLAPVAGNVWCLSGTPAPNSPLDLFPIISLALPTEVTGGYYGFRNRFCVVQKRWIMGHVRETVIGGKNEAELADMLRPIMLRRRATDLPPIRYSVYALHADKLAAENVDQQAILDAAEAEDTQALDMHLGPLRRELGVMKARAVVDVVAEDLQNGVDKIVLFFWHTDAGRILRDGLKQFGVVGIDGSTPADKRQQAVEDFQRGSARVFVGQIQAAGEAITLTAANQLVFVEISFTPKDMAQAVRRILRRGQTRPCTCRIAALEGSIDEALMRIVRRKVETIRAILED